MVPCLHGCEKHILRKWVYTYVGIYTTCKVGKVSRPSPVEWADRGRKSEGQKEEKEKGGRSREGSVSLRFLPSLLAWLAAKVSQPDS